MKASATGKRRQDAVAEILRANGAPLRTTTRCLCRGRRASGKARAGLPHSKLGFVAVGVEPVEGVDGFGQLVAGTAGEAVGLAGEANQRSFDFE